MHIAIVTQIAEKGHGQGRVNYEIAHEALRRGHEVTLVASSVAPDLKRLSTVDQIPIPVSQYPTQLVQDQIFGWRSAQWIRTNRRNLDVIVGNGATTWASVDLNIVHFVHSAWLQSAAHTSNVRYGPYAWYQRLYTEINVHWERRAFENAGRIVAVSEQVRCELLDIGVPEKKIEVIPNGVDPQEFHPGPSDRSSLDLPSDASLGIFVGDLKTFRKNLDTVLRAMQHLPHFHLAVVGSVEESPYPRLARELGVSDRTHFMGYRRDVPEIMRAADVCLCPSRYEPFSLAALEALASGLPVITSENVGAARLLPDDCGSVIDTPEDEAAIAEAIQNVFDEGRDGSCGSARPTATQYSFASMAERYADLLGL
jgi:glycosyltransferase involved in cell wall biosynthesis